jgi:hypothetical protein
MKNKHLFINRGKRMTDLEFSLLDDKVKYKISSNYRIYRVEVNFSILTHEQVIKTLV